MPWTVSTIRFVWPAILILLAGTGFPVHGQEFKTSYRLPEPTIFPYSGFEHLIRLDEDKNGFVWLATNRGLFCFDGSFFRKIHHTKDDKFSVVDAGQINDLYLDREKEQLWIATQAGASLLDLKTETFTDYFFYEKGKTGVTDGECNAVFKDRQGVAWFGVTGLGLVRFDTAFHYFPKKLKAPGDFPAIYQIVQDVAMDSILWLTGLPTGLIRFNKTTGTYFIPDRRPPDKHKTSLVLTALFPTKDKIFLGSTWRHGGFVYDIASGRFRELDASNPGFSGAILKLGVFQPRSPNTIWGFTDEGIVVIDVKGDSLLTVFRNITIPSENRNCAALPQRIWAGGAKGLLRYDFTTYSVENHRFVQDAEGRPGILRSAIEKEPGGKKLWLSFLFSNFIYDYDRESRAFKTIAKYPGTRLAPGGMVRLRDGRILATGDGGVFELRENRLSDLRLLPDLVAAKEEILAPFEDRDGRLWFRTRFAGFYELDPKTGAYRERLAAKKFWPSPHAFMESRGNFWLSGHGFSIYNPQTDRFLHFPFRPGERLSSIYPRGYEEDDEGNIWLSDIQVGGLAMVDARRLEKGIIERYDAPGGGQNNLMYTLKKDGRGRIWAVTEAGLQVFDPKAKTFRLFGASAGFQLVHEGDNSFNFIPSYLDLLSTGEMLVGYKNGFAIFHPDSLTHNRELPKPYLLAVSANEKPLTGGISFGSAEPLRLSHDQNVLEFEFSSIAFFEPGKIRYRYRLQGFDENWSETGRRFLRYTHLPPGKYSFQLFAINSDGLRAAPPLEWPFRILPPWWASWWAYLLYLLLAAAAVRAFYLYKKSRWQMRAQLDLEHREAERLKDLDSAKTRLYTNITHEFRTPLTLILGMAKQIKANPNEWLSEGLQMIERNGQSLLRLVNQMLDLSKVEAGVLPVHPEQGDVVAFLKYLLESFHSLAANKGIALYFHADREAFIMDYDPEKLREIVTNLLSNAVKFTPEGGRVELRFAIDDLRLTIDDKGLKRQISIVIQDNGIGIPPEKLPFIFDRFYQADDEATHRAEGAGIGLALTKELVKLLGGEIFARSEVGKGTMFDLRLPVSNHSAKRVVKSDAWNIQQESVAPLPAPNTSLPGAHLSLLIVEDNPDVVRYLQSILAGSYRIDVEENGRLGIEKAIESVPDIIISDVMMPEADGYELCETLKKDERSSHIPIILLTAKADAAARLEGLECGADAYLSKPFDRDELLVRLRKLVELRKRLQERYRDAAALPAASEAREIQIEDAFMKKVRDILEAQLGDEHYGIPDLCKALGMSRAQLYRKFQALTDQPVAHYLRSLRLLKAKTLLLATDLHVSEIVYAVGFKDPAHFTRAFSEEFGVSPTEMRKRL